MATGEVFERFVNDIFNESESEEEFGGSDSEEDNVEINNEDSESEQSADELEVNGDDEMDENLRFYIGKNQLTLWMNKPPCQNVRVLDRNVIPAMHAPGVKPAGKNSLTPIQAFELYFTDEILGKIVDYTNEKIDQLRGSYNRERDAKSTNLAEIKAVIGLLYLAGVKKSSHVNLKDLWARNGLGFELFCCVMSLPRFEFLLTAIRFDSIATRDQRIKVDNLAPIREIFTDLVENFQKYYSLGHLVTLDEKLEAFRGRCQFRQYIPNKPAKYGIKLFALVDARMSYTFNLEIYAAKQPEGPFKVSNAAKDVTMRMIKPIEIQEET
ncbi:piggyBac transposable element-derived protein 4-like [Homalodisca vitripennis]|uniref:piggyBac transposable element-derived protein 4-like n=1 Tax=Homalodisca vitripennis TaxID=197043 RepID=UPI001EEBE436|nr:piggyBac transposable element-derived protein 4-like [Homalodisca vitripennis]